MNATGVTWFGARLTCDLTDMIQQRIFYTGVWEPDISRLLANKLTSGDTFVDVGANVGYFSLFAAKIVGASGEVSAIEPWPATCQALRRNIGLNGFSNIRVIEQAVAARAGTMILHGGAPGNSGTTSQLPTLDARQQAIVSAGTLATLVGSETLRRAKVIKIDIEGGEVPVLREIFDLASQLSPAVTIVAEVTPSILADCGWPLATMVRDFAAIDFDTAQVRNDYAFDKDWWRFDPSAPARVMPVDFAAKGRFDLVLVRRILS